jgi:hypothetical protein
VLSKLIIREAEGDIWANTQKERKAPKTSTESPSTEDQTVQRSRSRSSSTHSSLAWPQHSHLQIAPGCQTGVSAPQNTSFVVVFDTLWTPEAARGEHETWGHYKGPGTS